MLDLHFVKKKGNFFISRKRKIIIVSCRTGVTFARGCSVFFLAENHSWSFDFYSRGVLRFFFSVVLFKFSPLLILINYAQVLLKSIPSSRINRLNIVHRFGSFALWAVFLHLRYSGLRMGWISVTRTFSRFDKRD